MPRSVNGCSCAHFLYIYIHEQQNLRHRNTCNDCRLFMTRRFQRFLNECLTLQTLCLCMYSNVYNVYRYVIHTSDNSISRSTSIYILTITIRSEYHVLDLCLGRIVAKRPHTSEQFHLIDIAVPIRIKPAKCFLQICVTTISLFTQDFTQVSTGAIGDVFA